MDFSEYAKPSAIRYMFIGAGIGFLLAGLVSGLANVILGIVVVLIGVVGGFFMSEGKRPPVIPKV